MTPFTAKADQAAWRTIYEHLVAMKVGELLTHSDLAELIPHIIGPESSLRRAILELQNAHSRTLDNVRGEGWRIAHAREHAGIARKGRQRAARQIDRSRQVVVHTRVEDLTPQEREAHRTVLDGLTFLSSVVAKHETEIEKLRAKQDSFGEEVDDRLAKLEGLLGVKKLQVIDAE